MTTATLTAAPSLAGLLRAPGATRLSISAFLDGLDEEARLREVRALPGGLQRKLWDACAGAAVSLDEFVPSSLPEGQVLVYGGRNSLPLFSIFEKRFARVGGAVVGYNHSAVSGLIGPGYFTVEPGTGARAGELFFDYERVPATAPAGCPPVRANTSGLGKLVFGGLHDFCRRVAAGVVIGEATRRGKPMGSYFVLARSPGQR